MSAHCRFAAWLHITAGLFVAGLVSTLWICAARLAPIFDGSFIPDLIGMFGRPIALTLLALAGLELAAAVALLRGRTWPRYALLAIGVLQLGIFPIGTALAAYTLWALNHAAVPARAPSHHRVAVWL